MSCRVVSCRVVSCRVVSCHVMSCHVMSCQLSESCLRSSAFQEELDQQLRDLAAEGYWCEQIWRFSKDIERLTLSCSIAPEGDLPPAVCLGQLLEAFEISRPEFLQFLTHSGVVIELRSSAGGVHMAFYALESQFLRRLAVAALGVCKGRAEL